MSDLYRNDPRVVKVSKQRYRFVADSCLVELGTDGFWRLWVHEDEGWVGGQRALSEDDGPDDLLWDVLGPPQK